MTDKKTSEPKNAKLILRFRQHAFLLQTQHKQIDIAKKLGVTKENYHKYYNNPEASPGLDFLTKFDELFGEEVELLINHLRTYKRPDLSILPTEYSHQDEYAETRRTNDYINALVDHIATLKDQVETYKGQIAFLQMLLSPSAAEKMASEGSGNFEVKIFKPVDKTILGDEKELKGDDKEESPE